MVLEYSWHFTSLLTIGLHNSFNFISCEHVVVSYGGMNLHSCVLKNRLITALYTCWLYIFFGEVPVQVFCTFLYQFAFGLLIFKSYLLILEGTFSSSYVLQMSPAIVCVSVCLGGYNKISQNRWLMNSANFLITVLEAQRPRSGCCNGRVRNPYFVADLSCILTWWRG